MKRYLIAGLTVDMEVSGRTQAQAEPYLTDVNGPADITLTCDVRRVLELLPELETMENAEYIGTGMMFARHLLKHQGTYLHSSGVVLDGKAYLFSANSGVGKSTHTEKWCRLFGAIYLNDDKPALRYIDGKWMAYGTPWSGKNDLSTPVGVELGGIAFLERGQENTITTAPADWAVPRLLHQSQWQLPQQHMETMLTLLDKLVRQIPIWRFTCRNEDAAAILSHDVMTKA